MKLRELILVATVLVLVTLTYALVRLGPANLAASTARSSAQRLLTDAARVRDLRQQARGLASSRRPEADLVARVQRALTVGGIPLQAFSGVQPRADQPVAGLPVRIQSVAVTFQGLTPAELGSWLHAFTSGDAPWRISEVQLAHLQDSAQTASLDMNRYAATVLLVAPYLEESP